MSGTLLIRADASPEIGIGHVMRMLALADAWRAEGGSVILFGALPAEMARLVVGRGVELAAASPCAPEDDGRRVDSLARRRGAQAVVADGYQFPIEFQRAVSCARLLVVDDNGENHTYDCDGVLNLNVHAAESMYSNRSGREQLLLGTRYTLLRREVLQSTRRTSLRLPIRRLLLSFGGADPANATGLALDALRLNEWDGETQVVIGAANPRRSMLESYGQLHGVSMVSSVTDMTVPMRWADLCICTPSTTFWELAWLGTPALLVSLADNQVELGRRLELLQCSRVLGDARTIRAPELARELEASLVNEHLLSLNHRTALALCDGLGAARVVQFLKTGRL